MGNYLQIYLLNVMILKLLNKCIFGFMLTTGPILRKFPRPHEARIKLDHTKLELLL